MEKGTFQTPYSSISSLEFRDEGTLGPTLTSAKTRSSTVESLISQNEDLMARLKVSVRRLSQLEGENESLHQKQSETSSQVTSLQDELLIWKEKESFWQKKNSALEQKITEIRARFPELEQMEEKIERYKKYHEKVKTQVKPYIQQLKSFAQNMALEIQKLNAEIDLKELKRLEIERKLHDLKLNLEIEHQKQTGRTEQLIAAFESEKEGLRYQIAELQKINTHLEERSEKLDIALSRQDELENMIIALRRALEENSNATAKQIHYLEHQERVVRAELTQKTVELENLSKIQNSTQTELERHKNQSSQYEQQITSLRHMWTLQSEELEKTKLANQSLEKLNLELSQRLNQARRGESNL